MWYSSRDDVDRCWMQPFKNTSADRRGIQPSQYTSTYRHRGVGYGHSPNSNNVHGVQHGFITPWQHRHLSTNNQLAFKLRLKLFFLVNFLFYFLHRKPLGLHYWKIIAMCHLAFHNYFDLSHGAPIFALHGDHSSLCIVYQLMGSRVSAFSHRWA